MSRINRLYCMDNLELLKKLPDESIDLIYSDILYNTGRKFDDFDDRLGSTAQALKWYRPRLVEMHRVLKSVGLIYLHMDYRLVHYLKVEMDKIFGEDNFRAEIIWCYLSGGISKKDFPKKHDNILKYSKSNIYTYIPEYKPYSKKTLERGLTKAKGNKYSLNSKGTPVVDWWDDVPPILSPTAYERVGYNTQKPRSLLRRIIETSSNKGDVVADFFMGSGTTIEVAKELDRNYVGCDINPRAVEVTQERLDKLKGNNNT